MTGWFERCECGKYANVKHECIYNGKDLRTQYMLDKAMLLLMNHDQHKEPDWVEEYEDLCEMYCDGIF